MKILSGYVIDRSSGLGIEDVPLSFNDLTGTPIGTGRTYWQSVPADTDANGRFEAKFELSPGPINVVAEIDVDEFRVRKHDEKAQMGVFWSSDGESALRGMGSGIIPGFMNELGLSIVSGHQYRINEGAAIVGGQYFSLENGPYVITGDANPSGPANPRFDLVTLRQWKKSVAGQDSGYQQIIVTNGTTTSVIPTEATGYNASNHDDLHIGVVSTAQGAGTKTVYAGFRPPLIGSKGKPIIRWDPNNSGPTLITGSFATINSIIISGLNPQVVYDGYAVLVGSYGSSTSVATTIYNRVEDSLALDGDVAQEYRFAIAPGNAESAAFAETIVPLSGITGVTSYTYAFKLKAGGVDAYISNFGGRMVLKPR